MVVQEEALPSALWLAQRMDKLEAKCCSMQDTAQDVLLVDLRTRRGVELATLDADAVVREATAWSHAEPRPLVSHLAKDYPEGKGYPEAYARPEVTRVLEEYAAKNCSSRGFKDVLVIACIGDIPPRRGQRLPPNFSHRFTCVTLRSLMFLREAIINGQKPDGVKKSFQPSTPDMLRTREERHVCGYCGKADHGTMKKCNGCKQVRYCGRDCQKQGWRAHKPQCRKYQQAAANVDRLSRRFGENNLLPAGRDCVKNLSEAGLDGVPSEQVEAFGDEIEEFTNHMINPGGPQLLSDQAAKLRYTKFSREGFGDSADVVLQKGRAGTRKIYCEMDYAGFRDFIARAYSPDSGSRVHARILWFDEADIRELWRTGSFICPALKRLLNSPDFDPRTHFLVRFEDKAIGPMASAHFLAEFARPIKEGAPSDELGFVPARVPQL